MQTGIDDEARIDRSSSNVPRRRRRACAAWNAVAPRSAAVTRSSLQICLQHSCQRLSACHDSNNFEGSSSSSSSSSGSSSNSAAVGSTCQTRVPAVFHDITLNCCVPVLLPAHEVELNNAATRSWTNTKKCDRCRQHTSTPATSMNLAVRVPPVLDVPTCTGLEESTCDHRRQGLPYVIVIAGCRPGSTGAISGRARCCRSWSDPPGADPLLPTTSAVL
jgi:hypothetical protein